MSYSKDEGETHTLHWKVGRYIKSRTLLHIAAERSASKLRFKKGDACAWLNRNRTWKGV